MFVRHSLILLLRILTGCRSIGGGWMLGLILLRLLRNKYGFIYYGWRWSDINLLLEEISEAAVAQSNSRVYCRHRPALKACLAAPALVLVPSLLPCPRHETTRLEDGVLIIKWRGRLLNFMVWHDDGKGFIRSRITRHITSHQRRRACHSLGRLNIKWIIF